MSEPTDFGGQTVVTEPADNTPVTPEPSAPPADNPAWAPFLEGIPSGLHGMMKDRLREWDAGVDERFRTVHSEYEPYKWAKDNQVNGEELQQAYAFWRQASDNPRHVFDVIGNNFGFFNEQGQQANSPVPTDTVDLNDFADPSGSAFNIEEHPAFKQMQEQNQRMQAFIDAQVQQQNDAQAEAWLNGVSDKLAKDFPGVDSQRVMAQAAGMIGSNPNVDPEQIIMQVAQNEQKFIESIRSAPAPGALAPTVLSPSGGSPVAPGSAQMTDAQRRQAAVEFLTKANQNL